MKRKPATDLQSAVALEEFPPYMFHLITSSLNNSLLERLRPHGVTVQRWRVLMVVANLGPRTITELARFTLIEQSAVSRVVDQMERDGLVARWASTTDNRLVRVQLTDHGRTTYHQLLPTAQEHADAMVAGFDSEERAQLYDFLRRIMRNMGVTQTNPKVQKSRHADE
jgi:DNA-binding MarR family transcriptional regulator